MREFVVLLSVDWEPDHGRWRFPGGAMDYGGILRGTPVFTELLDRLEVPCNWFVETSYDPTRDTPRLFPGVIANLASRKQDEVGLHIHWRRDNGARAVYYETNDQEWVSGQVADGVRKLQELGVRANAFRSGALLRIAALPRILNASGMAVDSSTLWGECNRVDSARTGFMRKGLVQRLKTIQRRAFQRFVTPYLTEENDVERRGTFPVVEFPIAYSIYEAHKAKQKWLYRFIVERARRTSELIFLAIFFHIDEILLAEAGHDFKREPDPSMLRHFAEHLTWLKSQGATFMVFSEARKRWLREVPALCGLKS